jgi:hypothetical protein
MIMFLGIGGAITITVAKAVFINPVAINPLKINIFNQRANM